MKMGVDLRHLGTELLTLRAESDYLQRQQSLARRSEFLLQLDPEPLQIAVYSVRRIPLPGRAVAGRAETRESSILQRKQRQRRRLDEESACREFRTRPMR